MEQEHSEIVGCLDFLLKDKKYVYSAAFVLSHRLKAAGSERILNRK
jgi:hypothetical protein